MGFELQLGYFGGLVCAGKVFLRIQYTELQLQDVVLGNFTQSQFLVGNFVQSIAAAQVGLGNLQIDLRDQQIEIIHRGVEGHLFHVFKVLLLALVVLERLGLFVPFPVVKLREGLLDADGKRNPVVQGAVLDKIIKTLELLLGKNGASRARNPLAQFEVE